MSDRRDILGINRRNMDLVFDDPRPGRFRDLDDKLRGKRRLEDAGVAVPRTLGVVTREADLSVLHDVLDEVDEVVLKPARGSGGRGILVLARIDGGWATPGGRRLDEHDVEDHARNVLSGTFSLDESADAVLLERRIHPHEFLAELYPHGLSDLRIVVEDGEPIQAMLRVPTDASDGRANLHGGGLGLGIDVSTGRIHHAVRGRRSIDVHPDTGARLLDRQVPEWDRCLDVARRAAQAFEEIPYLGVDIVLDARTGPVVLEMNARPGLGIQIANRAGQPVRRRRRVSRTERWTDVSAWLLLGMMLVFPLAFEWWQDDAEIDVRTIRTDRAATDDGVVNSDRVGLEWSDAGIPLSSVDPRFARARAAAAAGDTTAALALYREVADDDALAPFALNNIALIHRDRGDLTRARAVLERAIERFPDYARGTYNLGLVVRDLGDPTGAEAAFRAAIALRPGYANAWGALGDILYDRGAHAAAAEALERAVRYDPDSVADRWRLGRSLLELDRPGDAAGRLRESIVLGAGWVATRDWVVARIVHADANDLALSPASLDSLQNALRGFVEAPDAASSLHAIWAELLWRRGEPTAAVRWLDRPSTSLRTVGALALAASLDLDLGRWSHAIDRLRESDAPRLSRLRAVALLCAGLEDSTATDAMTFADHPFVDAALRRLRGQAWEPTELDPVDATERDWLSGSFAPAPSPRRLRAAEDARAFPVPSNVLRWWSLRLRGDGADWEAFDTIAPTFAPRLRVRFESAFAEEDWDLAHRLGVALLQTGEAPSHALARLVRTELRRGQPALARELLERMDPDTRSSTEILRLEVSLQLAEGDDAGARDLLARMVASDPTNADLMAALARAETRLGRLRAAVETWNRALQVRPEEGVWHLELARVLMDRRAYREAVDEWNRTLALPLDPDDARSARFNLALALQRDDRTAASLQAWDRYLTDVPDSRPARFNRALALQRLDRIEEAIRAFRSVLEVDPDHAASLRRLQALTSESDEDS